MEILRWLQEWYTWHCNGDWEHTSGIRITTLDNPGWYVSINLSETELASKQVEMVQIERTDDDWVHCKIEEGSFTGAGGPENLEEILKIFYRWAATD